MTSVRRRTGGLTGAAEVATLTSDVIRRASTVARIAASAVGVAAVTVLYFRFLPANPTTVALSYLVLVLMVATGWGIVESTVAAVLATVCFNIFFLPPVGRLTIADPQNWVSLVVFMITAIVASQLSSRARQRNLDATGRQRDLERLYTLSRALLLSDDRLALPASMARHIADAFELPAVGLYDKPRDAVSIAGPLDLPGIDEKLRRVAADGVALHEPSGVVLMPIRLGGAPIGALAIKDARFSDTVLQSVVNLAGIGLERARGLDASARAEAARQSGELRATVLDAVAHGFKTPLTSIKAAASSLGSRGSPDRLDRELVAIISEETERLEALVGDAIQMLRIDSGDFVLHRERHRLSDLVRATIRESRLHLDGRTLLNNVPGDLTVDVDGELLRLALRQLLDNALKYSPPTSTIEVEASDGAMVEIAVRNSGPPIPINEHARIFERFYRGVQGRQVPGTGMGLAIVQRIAQAHGGVAEVSSTSDAGTEFRLSLPRDSADSGQAAGHEHSQQQEPAS